MVPLDLIVVIWVNNEPALRVFVLHIFIFDQFFEPSRVQLSNSALTKLRHHKYNPFLAPNRLPKFFGFSYSALLLITRHLLVKVFGLVPNVQKLPVLIGERLNSTLVFGLRLDEIEHLVDAVLQSLTVLLHLLFY